ncbi:hypothetical protein IL38_24005 [Actinopolyspora erythraea]|uniref:DUF932 domain-containing protein n=1 Tax=Actinopolyspora erythraea TaxID=414996 RepID=A0ABR4WYA5_9ACTN|nr:DUF932 domain-containing protein [Actinopolyspora erythraea]KGI79365.1 hypothetical protein IL38_24005 [Actinopolyspora erythraea]
MPAEFDSGMFVREPAWHRLGVVLDDYPGSWEEARRLAGLDWEPVEEPQFRRVQTATDASGEPIYDYREVPGYKYVVRSDNGAILDSANSSYELITHADMGEIIEAILDNAEVKYETAGSLYGGRKVWALARLGQEIELPGDNSPTLRYLALMNSHDGTAALKALGTGVRIVCANTWHAADIGAEKTGTAFSFRHTRNWRENVENAQKAVTGAFAQMDKYVEKARSLLSMRLDGEAAEQFVQQFAIERTLANTNVKRSDLDDYLLTNPRVAQSMADTQASLKAILRSETCNELPETAYKYIQAAGEFADHFKPSKNDDTYFTRTVVNIEPLKQTATKLATKLATPVS